jgi:large subunit ribosomal protein L24
MQATKPVKKPGKQRKRLYNAPAHLRHKLMAAPLSAELISSKGAKTLPVRKGDTVRIMRGDHKGFEGKISRVDLKRYRIFIEGLTREKVDGTNIFVSVHPSKVTIKNLKLDDKWRKEIVERKKELERPEKEKKVTKVVAEVAEKAPKKTVEAKKEKIVKEKAAVQKKPVEKVPKAIKKTIQKKPIAKKKKADKAAAEEEKPAEKETKPKATKKPRAKRKTTSKTEGGT